MQKRLQSTECLEECCTKCCVDSHSIGSSVVEVHFLVPSVYTSAPNTRLLAYSMVSVIVQLAAAPPRDSDVHFSNMGVFYLSGFSCAL
jgi:hypothetical protein